MEILDRRCITVTTPDSPGAVQPYHFAKNLELAEAERFLAKCFAASQGLVLTAVRSVVDELPDRQFRLVGSAVVLASGRPLPPLANILVSHALIHTAEGEFFRQAFSKACAGLDLAVTGLPERDLEECARMGFGKEAARMQRQISILGRSLGPSWSTDQRTAALAALLVLAGSRRQV